MSSLRGAVADADDASKFFETRVPIKRIRNLRDQQATRKNILKELESLATNDAIKKNDPIIIFFAGHGALAKLPEGWNTGGREHGRVQLLCPYGFLPEANIDMRKQGIPSLTLANVLNDISRAKGNNITVILDCCYAGGGARHEDDDTYIMKRSVDLDNDYIILPTILPTILQHQATPSTTTSSPELDEQVARAHHQKFDPRTSGFWSSIVLAACKDTEVSLEENGRGRFSKALFEALRAAGNAGELDGLTYESLIDRLSILDRQNPQCIGGDKARLLFSFKTFDSLVYFEVTKSEHDGIFHLNAGEASGINTAARFNVYGSKSIETQLLATLTVIKTTHDSADLKPTDGYSDFHLPPSGVAYARQIHGQGSAESLKLVIPPGKPLLTRVSALVNDAHSNGRLRVLPDMRLVMDGDDTVAFEVKNGIWRDQNLKTLYYKIQRYTSDIHPRKTSARLQYRVRCRKTSETSKYDDDTFDDVFDDEDSANIRFADRVFSVISSAANFYFHLSREPTKANPDEPIADVRLECFELDEVRNGPSLKRFTREKDPKTNLIDNGALNVSVSVKKVLGFKIINGTDVPLYAALFYFDMSDLSIMSYYEPSLAKGSNAQQCIPAGGELTVGYGSGTGRPRRYALRDGQTIDVAYLKLFYSTRWVDYSRIKQSSPFSQEARFGDQIKSNDMVAPVWNTISVRFTQTT
ncbi:uncharacterized protein STEHIDRAFT_107519 [Stereum hirsutum FP-91666 SS1]|uniref:uncharacterized protein n=1 Tax=Stereum hirsutum (strain FP-91666) TaxID=721885 RepID=UPI000440E725|nr:uncharacterized protein STEHIDRAFT_107519 [Stereum hirsutum FP-91666 SS1]EIM90781.1 hypothetical protein STEHIDRAFT_107519 [Stereum hirsutum FP-91666 SS1]